MIRTYFLPVYVQDETEKITGSDYLHDCLIETTDLPMVRRVIMDTTDPEHALLAGLALDWHLATVEEAFRYQSIVTPLPPDPDYDTVCEILKNSPVPIPAPELAILLRIVCKRLGYDF